MRGSKSLKPVLAELDPAEPKLVIAVNALIKVIATTKLTPQISYYAKNSQIIYPDLFNEMVSVLQVGILENSLSFTLLLGFQD